jgi:ABC-2 type transport system permease protein
VSAPSNPTEPGAPLASARQPSAFVALFRLFLRTQITRARLAALTIGGALAIVVAFALRRSAQTNPDQIGAVLVGEYGLWLLVPITALLLASATLGEMYDDGTLVYVWLRPVGRTKVALAAILSSLVVALPLDLVPLLVAAVVSGSSSMLAVGVLVTVTLSLLAYVPAFCALGLRSRRSFIWGLLYIFIVEGFVARGGESLAKLAVRSYSESVLASITGANLEPFSVIGLPWAWIVPLAVGGLSLGYLVRRLRAQDIP